MNKLLGYVFSKNPPSGEVASREAILHIGTEKTGSTSIQNFFFKNRKVLKKNNILFPATCGFVSHHKLVLFSKSDSDESLLRTSGIQNDEISIERWRSDFLLEHCSELSEFHRNGNATKVVYSSEHFQSRVRTKQDIEKIYKFMSAFYDQITLIVYLRRQDKLALSAYNTAVQGGLDKPFSFNDLNSESYYYNYNLMLGNWISVFGENSIKIRLFEGRNLHNNNVVDDFLHEFDIPKNIEGVVEPAKVNERLSHTALEILRYFNSAYKNQLDIHGVPIHEFRQSLISNLHTLKDDIGIYLPPVDQARAFYQACKVHNEKLFNTYLKGSSFDECFDEYPLSQGEAPTVSCEPLLADKIGEVMDTKYRYISSFEEAI